MYRYRFFSTTGYPNILYDILYMLRRRRGKFGYDKAGYKIDHHAYGSYPFRRDTKQPSVRRYSFRGEAEEILAKFKVYDIS